jgi:hypothetical protein
MKQRLLLHIGLHKTATTYLQNKVWGTWTEVGYAGRPNPPGYRSSEDAVFDLKNAVVLLSNESSGGSLKQSYLPGKSWIASLRAKLAELKTRYAGRYEIGVLLGLRRHDKWVLSIYKHYLKYGGVEGLDGFLGLEEGTPPTLPMEDLFFMDKIRCIEEVLGVRPFCFFLEELRQQPEVLSAALAAYAGVATGPEFVTGATLNEGVDAAEAALCLWVNRRLVNPGCRGSGRIRRNKTIGFDLARRAKSLGLLKKTAGEVACSAAAHEFVRKTFADDLSATIGRIEEQRGSGAGRLRTMVGEL